MELFEIIQETRQILLDHITSDPKVLSAPPERSPGVESVPQERNRVPNPLLIGRTDLAPENRTHC